MRRLFFALLLAQLVPIWWWTYFPSQDGPSHLYNAAVVSDYSRTPLYQEFYTRQVSPAGNLLSQVLQVGLSWIVPPLIAEKLLLSLYLTLFAAGFRYLVRSFAPSDEDLSLFGSLLSANWFLHMGFWNFCLSLPLAFLALGHFVRGGRWPVYLALVWLTYLAHPLAWAFLAGIVGWLWMFRFRDRWGIAAITVTPIGLAALFHSGGNRTIEPGSLPWDLTSLLVHLTGFLYSFSLLEWAAGVAAVSILAFVGIVKGRRLLPSSLFWLAVLLCAASFAGPESYGTGTFIRERVMFFAVIVLTLAVAEGDRKIGGIGIAFAICAGISIAARQTSYRNWNVRIGEYSRFAAQLPAGSRVLPLSTSKQGAGAIRPLLHAFGYQTDRPLINLRNYEAGVDYFPVRFRPERSPFTRIGIVTEMEKDPPRINLAQYDWIDYVLVDGPYQLSQPGYTLAAESKTNLELRLYRRER